MLPYECQHLRNIFISQKTMLRHYTIIFFALYYYWFIQSIQYYIYQFFLIPIHPFGTIEWREAVTISLAVVLMTKNAIRVVNLRTGNWFVLIKIIFYFIWCANV